MTAVVKIGGSLAADPDRLRALLTALADGAHGPCVIVPGGGAFADAVRAAQVAEGFSDAEAHRRALDAMGRMADLFCGLEPRLTVTVAPRADASRPPAEGGGSAAAAVWDPVLLRPGHPDIAESWAVTSDSLAVWLAARIGARTCVLVKSTDAAPGLDPAGLARAGLVDAAFPAFAARFAGDIAVWGPGGPVPVVRRAAA
ncbi:uridylate kinase [Methylobacterium sp. NEAU 140]|uniref:amino acid kinase family protein n=1 Tax=Methylobacterium sp. NEAU 140 TaxID=3064945 RepID=UPI002734B377|nr:uridylate kinase [Methylobacterium sp. NEAU 140]MDP4026199.1 uridylate kinase [Methylobacterium sp. NEAU 140]